MLIAAGIATVFGLGATALSDIPTMERLADNLEEKCNLTEDFRRLVEVNDELIKKHGVGILDMVEVQDDLCATRKWFKDLSKLLSDKLIPRTRNRADLDLHRPSHDDMTGVCNDLDRLREIIMRNTPVRDVKKVLFAFDRISTAWTKIRDDAKVKRDAAKERAAKEEKEAKVEEEANALRNFFRDSRLASPPENLKALEEFFAAGKASPIESFFEDVLAELSK